MREKPKKQLCDDILAHTLAHSRQRRRWSKAALASAALLTCATLVCLQHAPQRENPIQTAASSSETVHPAPDTESIDEFAPLLEQLADAGPIIITLPNGDRELILTK